MESVFEMFYVGTGNTLIEANRGMEVIVDPLAIPLGIACVFLDLIAVHSLEDDIERITWFPFALKSLTFEKLGLTVVPAEAKLMALNKPRNGSKKPKAPSRLKPD